MHTTRRASRMLATSLAAMVLVAACGGDDDEGATASPAADRGVDLTAFCDHVLAIETAPGPEIDFESASEDEIADAARVWASDVERPIADDIVASAPDELADDVRVLSGAIDEIADSGDLGVFDQPAVAEAADRFDTFTAGNCGWATLSVTAVDYAFVGVPATVEAGPTRIELTNDGSELHEFALFRRNDGVDQPVEELLALPDDEVLALVTPVGADSRFAPPDESDAGVYVLDPGRYIAVCLVPIGMTSFDAEPPPDAPPHAAEGMVAEFNVE